MAATSAQMAVKRELVQLMKRPVAYDFVVQAKEDDVMRWDVYLLGPRGTLYEGGCYKALMRFPAEYPMEPPSLQFTGNILHPNIYRDGKVCISTLQIPTEEQVQNGDTESFWRPIQGAESALMSVVSLLDEPNLDDPANPDARDMMVERAGEFKETCTVLARKSMEALPSDLVMPVHGSSRKAPASSSSSSSCTPVVAASPLTAADGDEDYVYSDYDDGEGEDEQEEQEEKEKQEQEQELPKDKAEGEATDSHAAAPTGDVLDQSAAREDKEGLPEATSTGEPPADSNSQLEKQVVSQPSVATAATKKQSKRKQPKRDFEVKRPGDKQEADAPPPAAKKAKSQAKDRP